MMKTILVVEDEELLRELLVVVLEEKGYRVLEAGDGVEAYETFKTHCSEIDLVLSDLGLPRLGGWEAFSKMRELNPLVKGILASGYFEPDLKERIIASGARHFVQKPYNPPEILSMIEQLVEEQ